MGAHPAGTTHPGRLPSFTLEHFTELQMPQASKYLLPLNRQGLALSLHSPEGWAGWGQSWQLKGSHVALSVESCPWRKRIKPTGLPWWCSG